jgi:hypothetical protein
MHSRRGSVASLRPLVSFQHLKPSAKKGKGRSKLSDEQDRVFSIESVKESTESIHLDESMEIG